MFTTAVAKSSKFVTVGVGETVHRGLDSSELLCQVLQVALPNRQDSNLEQRCLPQSQTR
jgi:hypothetical protein